MLRINSESCSRFCLCKKKLLERSLSLPCGVVRQREAVGNNEERVLSTVSRSACVFLQADCPQIHRVILRLKFNVKVGHTRSKKRPLANPHSIRGDFSKQVRPSNRSSGWRYQ